MKKPWFKAKQYGWGWGLPATWQGWVVFIAWLAFIIFDAIRLSQQYRHKISDFLTNFIIQVLIASIILGIIIYRTGEKPRWRWGK